MTTSLVEDFIIAKLQSDLAIEEEKLEVAKLITRFNTDLGSDVLKAMSEVAIQTIKQQLEPLLAKQNSQQ